MIASKNSLHAKLYNFTYMSALPNNLCVYFWKVLLAGILFIPNFLVQAPSIYITAFEVGEFSTKADKCKEQRQMGYALYFLLLIITVYLIYTFHFIKALCGFPYDSQYAVVGGVWNCMIFAVLLYCFINIILNHKNEKNNQNIFIEFAKAKYNKYCPKIDWK